VSPQLHPHPRLKAGPLPEGEGFSGQDFRGAVPWDSAPQRSRGARVLLAAAAAVLLAANPVWAAGGERLFLTGNDQALWLVRSAGDGNFDVAIRPTGLPWKVVGRDLSGTVQAAVAVEGHVHLLLSDPFAHLIIHPAEQEPVQAQSPQDERWPLETPILAAFGTGEPNAKDSSSALVVVVADSGGRPATRSSTSRSSSAQSSSSSRPAPRSAPAERPALRLPATGAALTLPAARGSLQLFQYTDGQWEQVAQLPDVVLSPRMQVLGAAADGMIYLYVAGEPGRAPRLVRWDGLQWQSIGALPPAGPMKIAASDAAQPEAASATASAPSSTPATFPAAGGRHGGGDVETVFAMVSLGRAPILLRAVPAAGPARWRVQLAALGADDQFTLQEVHALGEAANWGEVDFVANPLRAARLGGQIALLWKQQGGLEMGSVDLTGQLVPQGGVEVLQPEEPIGQGEDIRNYVILGALILSSLLALQMRGRVPLRPLALPPGVTVADPLRRMLAGLIDLVPLCMLAGAFAPVPPGTLQELLQRAKDNRLPNSMYIAGMGSICLYVAYCVFMEHRFGTTVGKAALKLRVTNDQGQPATLQQLALRNVLKIVELLWPSIPVLLLMPLLNRSRQRLGDLFARTVVVSGKPLEESPREGGEDDPPME
jgi:uncharacterized RDD family membrane protein YckC